MIKLFVTDLDGTLLKERQKSSSYAAALTIKCWNNNSNWAVWSRSVQIYKDLGVRGHRVSPNGTFVFDAHNLCIADHHFTADLSEQLLDKIQSYHVHYLTFTIDGIHYDKETEFAKDVQKLFKFPLVHSPHIAEQFGN